MRRMLACVLCLIFLLSLVVSAPAESAGKTYVMAGYDTEDSKHVWDDNLFFRRMAERTGIDFTFQEYTDETEWKTVKANMKPGSELPDVLFKASLTEDETQAMYEAGVLIDLKPYLETWAPNLSALLKAHPEYEKAITLRDGAIVALPQINGLPTNNVIWINQTWLNRLKLDMPTTADELTEVLRAMQSQDPNRNGNRDEIPMTFTGLWDLKFLAHAFGMTPNDYGIEVVDGQVVFDYTTDQYRAFLTWLHTLYEENLIDHNGFLTLDTARAVTDANATIPFGCVFGPTVMNMLPSTVMNDYTVLILSHDGKTVYRELLGEVFRGTFAITSSCENPGELLSWVDYLYSEEGCYLAASGQLHDEYEVTSDGAWYWVDDIETVQASILVDSTISEGNVTPMYMSASYQLAFDNEEARNAVEGLKKLHEIAVYPYPLMYMTAEEKAEIAQIWGGLGSWCEIAMTWFITGEQELTDENWAAFVSNAEEKGAGRLTAAFQKLLNE